MTKRLSAEELSTKLVVMLTHCVDDNYEAANAYREKIEKHGINVAVILDDDSNPIGIEALDKNYKTVSKVMINEL